MTLTNAYIVYRYNRKIQNKKPPKHFAFFEELMEQFIAIDSGEASAAIEHCTRPASVNSINTANAVKKKKRFN
ncbi:hypothetical protein PHMEG_00012570 [Phytophthora megakarya]|uniref:Uncharacterized protein n=1 Tax=Phytophthora megakarya TaxID=4795 RepID=A0A225WAI1_9STRA|nr:hypothetical protein PHMEG_00012570 [Phytophthora megakarya]